MPLVHAFNRKAPITVTIGQKNFHFKPAEDDDTFIVCDVPEGSALDRLLSITEGYRLMNAEPSADAPAEKEGEEGEGEEFSKYVITVGENDEQLDLRTLSDEQLRAFIAQNPEAGIKVHPSAKGDTIRDKIVAAFMGTED